MTHKIFALAILVFLLLTSACSKSPRPSANNLTSVFTVTHDPKITDLNAITGGLTANGLQGAAGGVSVSTYSYDFGVVIPQQSRIEKLYVYNFSAEPITFTGMTLEGPDAGEFGIEPMTALPVTVAANDSLTLEVTFRPRTQSLLKLALLTVQSNGKGYYQAALYGTSRTDVPNLQVYGGTDPYLYLIPNQFRRAPGVNAETMSGVSYFGDCASFVDVNTPLRIKNDGFSTLRVSSVAIKSDDGAAVLDGVATVPLSIAAGGFFDFKVKLLPEAAEGNHSLTVAITSNDPVPGKEIYIFKLSLYNPPKSPCPRLQLSSPGVTASAMQLDIAPAPQSLRIGALKSGDPVLVQGSLVNAGNSPMTIHPGDIVLDKTNGPDWTGAFDANNVVLAPGEVYSFKLRLNGTGSKTENLDLAFLSSLYGTANGTVSIPVGSVIANYVDGDVLTPPLRLVNLGGSGFVDPLRLSVNVSAFNGNGANDVNIMILSPLGPRKIGAVVLNTGGNHFVLGGNLEAQLPIAVDAQNGLHVSLRFNGSASIPESTIMSVFLVDSDKPIKILLIGGIQ
jgi:hypothetical protein